MIKKYIIIGILAIITAITLYSQDEKKAIFINSNPINADIIINGVQIDDKTPAVIRNVEESKINIVIKKQGFFNYKVKTEFKDKNYIIADVILTSITFSLLFPENVTLLVGNTEQDAPILLTDLKLGSYNFNRKESSIKFDYEYPLRPFTYVGIATTAATFTGAVICGLAALMINQQVNNMDPDNNDLDIVRTRLNAQAEMLGFFAIGFSGGAVASGGTTAGLAISEYFWKRKNIVKVKTKNEQEKFDYEIYNQANSYFNIGDWTRSIQFFETVIKEFPNSKFVSLAYYNLGQLYSIQEDTDNASKYWNIFIDDYPLADYYDSVMKNLADIYFNNNQFITARKYLDNILFIEDKLNRELILAYKGDIDFELYKDTKEEQYLIAAENEFLSLLQNYKDSTRKDLYNFRLVQLYDISKNQEKLRTILNNVKDLRDIDPKIQEDINDIKEKNNIK